MRFLHLVATDLSNDMMVNSGQQPKFPNWANSSELGAGTKLMPTKLLRTV